LLKFSFFLMFSGFFEVIWKWRKNEQIIFKKILNKNSKKKKKRDYPIADCSFTQTQTYTWQ
jgi:hypothetical protein